MTERNESLRGIVKGIEAVATQCLHSQPEDDDDCERQLIKALAKIAGISKEFLGFREVEAYDIDWDTPKSVARPPSSMRVMMAPEWDLEDSDALCGVLSDKTTWCVNALSYRILP